MKEAKSYRVLVTEIFQKTVAIQATSKAEAYQRAEDAWKNAEFILGEECFQGAEFHVLGGRDMNPEGEKLEWVDRKEGDRDA